MYKIPIPARFIFAIYLLLISAHLSASLNIDPSYGLIDPMRLLPIFFFTLIPFWILLIFKFNKIVKGSSNNYIFKQIKKNLSPWISKLVILNLIYGIGSFLFAFGTVFSNITQPQNLGGFRVFSAHLSMFYIITFAGITGIANYRPRQCANGHEINIDAQFCPECGAKV